LTLAEENNRVLKIKLRRARIKQQNMEKVSQVKDTKDSNLTIKLKNFHADTTELALRELAASTGKVRRVFMPAKKQFA